MGAQGRNAPGGQYDYIINGYMIAGYALVAYPDKWGSSGVMTFVVNEQGRVYQKDLGLTQRRLHATWSNTARARLGSWQKSKNDAERPRVRECLGDPAPQP
jgi:hypothetical protein